MLQNLLVKLKDRPILSILLCVVCSEIIQLVITLISRKPPTFHYGIAVVALLALFVTPILLSIQNKRNHTDAEKADDDLDQPENSDEDTQISE